MNFDALIYSIADVHTQLQASATKAVNISLTLRNWLIGGLIVRYQLDGEDRAKYGEKVLLSLADRLRATGLPHLQKRDLYRYCDFYRAYPQILESVTPQLAHLLFGNAKTALGAIVESVTPQLGQAQILGPSTLKSDDESPTSIVATPLPQFRTPGKHLVERLSYTHLELLTPLDPPIKRTFYEIECIKGCWSVRELKRQIASLYFERSGLSRDKEALSRMANEAAEADAPALVIRDPFVFDFLGIHAADALSESELEAALMKHLQRFLLELGRGFCFEAQQKRLLIGDEYFFCDLVFYHRVLKCHVLIELKTEAFSHEHLGQLNAYVAYYREHEMQPGDQPPVGILLCTQQNQALVKYALAGMDQSLFVSRYQTQLPDTQELEAFLHRELKLWEQQHA